MNEANLDILIISGTVLMVSTILGLGILSIKLDGLKLRPLKAAIKNK